jgi:hypothetical protein
LLRISKKMGEEEWVKGANPTVDPKKDPTENE